jgi:VanZ family protein
LPRRWLVRWGPVVLYTLLILAVSSIPRLNPPGAWVGSDKIAHGIEYAILGALVFRAVPVRGVGAFAAAFGIALGVGAIDELYQSTVPGRSTSLYDWLADGAGGLIGAALGSLLASRGIGWLQRREREQE